MSSQMVDVLFGRALDAIPSELSLALRAVGLDDAGILDSYPVTATTYWFRQGSLASIWRLVVCLRVQAKVWMWYLRRWLVHFYFLSYCPFLSFLPCRYLFVDHRLSVFRPVHLSFPHVWFLLVARTDVNKLGVLCEYRCDCEERGSKKHRRVTKSGRARRKGKGTAMFSEVEDEHLP